MPYVPFNADWQDSPSVATPITAAFLEYIETGVAAAMALGEAAIAKALVDAKGDLLVGTAADTVARQAVGAADTVLAADAGQSTGVVWKKIGNAMIASDAAIAASKLAAYPGDSGKYLAGDGTWPDFPTQTTSYGTSFPGSPTTGDEHILVDSTTTPTYHWRFRYNGNSTYTYKWEFIGGTWLSASVATQQQRAVAGSYADLATSGPSVTVPRNGDYLVRLSVQIVPNQSFGSNAYMSFNVGGTGAVDADAVSYGVNFGSSNAAVLTSLSRIIEKSGLTATTVLLAKYKATGSAADFLNRNIAIQPIRLS